MTNNSFDQKTELRIKILKDDLAYLRKIETWGSSLFLTAIALVTLKLLEMESKSVLSKNLFSDLAFIAPAIIGIVFYFSSNCLR